MRWKRNTAILALIGGEGMIELLQRMKEFWEKEENQNERKMEHDKR